MAALLRARRTGEGQYIDYSQSEGSIHNLTPILLDYTVNGHVAQRVGNDDTYAAPHGTYPCTGEDNWVAVACETDEQWHRLCHLIGNNGDRTAHFDGMADWGATQRLARRRELDDVVSRWTADRSAEEVTVALQAIGVPAHSVLDADGLFADPQLAYRGHFVEAPHGRLGTTWVESSRFRLSRTPATMRRAGPTIGEDTLEVLSEVLGYDGERIADLAAAEVLE